MSVEKKLRKIFSTQMTGDLQTGSCVNKLQHLDILNLEEQSLGEVLYLYRLTVTIWVAWSSVFERSSLEHKWWKYMWKTDSSPTAHLWPMGESFAWWTGSLLNMNGPSLNEIEKE